MLGRSRAALELMDIGLLARRYSLAVYWLAFAALTVDWGQHPGFVAHPELAPYPWNGVAVTLGVLAVEVAILYAILRPVTFHRSWGRLGFALLYAGILLVVSAFTFVTDLPGYYYAPAIFSAATMLGLILLTLVLGLSALWQRGRHVP